MRSVAMPQGTWSRQRRRTKRGAVMRLAVWSRNGTSPLGAAVWAAGAGLCYGLTMAFICSRQRRKHDLPPWESLRDVPGPHGGRSAPLRH